MNRAVLLVALTLAAPAAAEDFKTDPDAGNNVFTAVFDAKLGERITAQSSAVGCDLTYDQKIGTASGACSVPLTSIKVDNEETKTEHFQQWVTNKKSEPKDCRLEAKFQQVKVGKLVPEQPATFTSQIPFTVCGRGPVDGRHAPLGLRGSAKRTGTRARRDRGPASDRREGPSTANDPRLGDKPRRQERASHHPHVARRSGCSCEGAQAPSGWIERRRPTRG